MKTFVFKLQTALNMKLRQEDLVKKDLEQAIRLYEESSGRLLALQKEMVTVQDDLRQKQSNNIKVDDVQRCLDFIPVLAKKIERQAQDKSDKQVKVHQIRAQLVQIMKDRKVLEKLRSRHHQEYVRQILAEEQKQIDEMALHRFMRREQSN